MKKLLLWGAKFALSGALIWYIFSKVDLGSAWEKAAAVKPVYLVASGLIILFQILMATLRWQVVIDAIGASLRFLQSLQILFIGLFFNLVLPSSVGGDAVRIWKSRQAGLTTSQAINSVMLERIATVFGLILLVTVTQPFVLGKIDDPAAKWIFPALSFLGIAGIVFLMFLDRLPKAWAGLRIVRGLAKLALDTRTLFLSPKEAGKVMGLAVLGHANISLSIYVLGKGLGVEADPIDFMVLIPPVILVTTLPISIAGWGVREMAMVVALGFIDVPIEIATVLSILYGVVNTIVCLPGGVIWLLAGAPSIPEEEENNGADKDRA